MSTGQSQFVGAAGQFHLAYGLSVRQIIASITIGNTPNIDVLSSLTDGKRSISFQVKTSRNAYRKRRYGHEGYEWDVNRSVIDNHSESFWYAFIDLQECNDLWNPKVFFVPSIWVSNFVKPDFSRFLYFLPKTAEHLTLERWDLVKSYLNNEQSATNWAKALPPKNACAEWGTREK